MELFYGLAALLAVITVVLIARPFVRAALAEENRDAREVQLYRDQLAEIDRDLERGIISESDAEGARAEVSRRLLAAAERAEKSTAVKRAPRGLTRLVSLLLVVGLPVFAGGFYFINGSPGMPDRPLAERTPADLIGLGAMPAEMRLGQEEAEAQFGMPAPREVPDELKQYAELITRLEQVVSERPDDVTGLSLLADGYIRLGRYREAWQTFHRLIRKKGAEAAPEDYTALAEAMIFAAGGYVSREAEQALATAINRDPSLPQTRYYAAMSIAQDGRTDQAVAMWEKLRAEAPADAPWRSMIDAILAEVQRQQNGGPGPGAADIAAAEEMSAEERQAMIEGMVGGLEDRLTTDGGPPEDWLKLMNAYVQLGRRDDAVRVTRLALAAFDGQGEADFIREQALLMGLIEK